jgi:hypothetical protein
MCDEQVDDDCQMYNGDKFHAYCVAHVMVDEAEGLESTTSWTMVVQTKQVNALGSPTLEADEVWVLWDSGSDEHLCSPKLAKFGRPLASKGQPMMDVQGNPISDKGAANVSLQLSNYDG